MIQFETNKKVIIIKNLWIIVNRVTIIYIGFEDFPNVVDEANRKMVVRHFSPGEFESHYLKLLQL